MAIGDNIKALRTQHGMTQLELGRIAGVSDKAVSSWESGLSIPRMGAIEKIASYFHVPKSIIIDGTNSADTTIPPGFLPLPETESLPLVGRIACGTPILAEENVEGYVDVPKSARATFVLLCQGDSMAPRIQDGDFVYVRKQPTVENGELAAVRIGTEATLKRVYYSPDRPDQLFLQAENPSYPPMIYSGQELEDIAIEGKIVGIYRVVQH